MGLAIVKIKNSAGEVRQERWTDGPNIRPGNEVLKVGTVTWQTGETRKIAALSVPHPIALRTPGSNLRTIDYVVWSGEVELHVGDILEMVASSGYHFCESAEEYFKELEEIIGLHDRGEFELIDDDLKDERGMTLQDKLK